MTSRYSVETLRDDPSRPSSPASRNISLFPEQEQPQIATAPPSLAPDSDDSDSDSDTDTIRTATAAAEPNLYQIPTAKRCTSNATTIHPTPSAFSSLYLTPNTRIPTHLSLGPENAYDEPPRTEADLLDAKYDRFDPKQRSRIVMVLAFCGYLGPIASTMIMSATPEVAAAFRTTDNVIGWTSAVYLLCMGLSPMVWAPMSRVYGRRPVALWTLGLFCLGNMATGLAPSLPLFIFFRIVCALQGTAFVMIGAACVVDMYRPLERQRSLGLVLRGTVLGPVIGPLFGGVVVTFISWRNLFWMITGVTAIAFLLVYFLLVETIHHRKRDSLEGVPRARRMVRLAGMCSPYRVCTQFRYANILLTSIASASLVWNMYSLLAPVRFILNPRFDLTAPWQVCLFYLAPGLGFLVGMRFGGPYAAKKMRARMDKRGGELVPEDRLLTPAPFMGIMLPVCVLIYGWCVHYERGGVPVVVIPLFLQGVGQLFCFPSLNGYCLEALYDRGHEVISGNYLFRYFFAAIATGSAFPALEAMGPGWFSTISAGFLVCSTLGLLAVNRWGREWRETTDEKIRVAKLIRANYNDGRNNPRVGDLEKGTTPLDDTEKPYHHGQAQGGLFARQNTNTSFSSASWSDCDPHGGSQAQREQPSHEKDKKQTGTTEVREITAEEMDDDAASERTIAITEPEPAHTRPNSPTGPSDTQKP